VREWSTADMADEYSGEVQPVIVFENTYRMEPSYAQRCVHHICVCWPAQFFYARLCFSVWPELMSPVACSTGD